MAQQSAKKADPQKQGKEPEFGIQRLYIKDLSFEAPNTPAVFLEEWNPELHMDIGTKSNRISTGEHEVVLQVTVTVKQKDKTIFLIEVYQAGIFVINNFPKDQLKPMLGSFCPNILYPYAREVVTDIIVRGGFPHLYLTPVNFDTLYQEQEAEAAKKKKQSKK